MRAYVLTTGVLFGLITVSHLLRMILENPRFAADPIYLALTLLSAGLCAWAFRLAWRPRR